MDELWKLPEFTWEEIRKHTDAKSCWCVIHGLVYDLTKFLDYHPGSSHVLLEVAGEDATEGFEEVGHSLQSRVMADDYLVGRLKGATNMRKCKKEDNLCCKTNSEARGNKGGTSLSLIVVMVLVALIGIWAYFHFQDDDGKIYQRITAITETVE